MKAQNSALVWGIAVTGLVILGGCVVENNSNSRSVSGGGCTPGTIYDVGFEDGTQGFPVNRRGDFRRCPPNVRARASEAYRAGWDAGIARYCTEENGFVLAAQGVADAKNCPRNFSKDFRRGRSVGNDVFKENQSIIERGEKLNVLDRNIQSGRFSPEQLEVLLRDRRKLLKDLRKDERQLARLLARAEKRGYPVK